jgi:hypothetical protein
MKSGCCFIISSIQFFIIYVSSQQPHGQELHERGISSSQGRYIQLNNTNTQRENKRKWTFMPLLGFEPMIPVFERMKAVQALGREATVMVG